MKFTAGFFYEHEIFNLAGKGRKSLERVLNMQEITDGKYLLDHLAHSFSSARLFSTVM